MHAKHLLLLSLLSATTCTAFAQWQWVDDNGRKVFSDRPPPAHIAPANVLKRPQAAQGNAPAAAPASSATPTAAAPAAVGSAAAPAGKPPSGIDPALEEKKAAQEAAEAAQKKAEEARQAQARKENCARARQARDSMASGRLMATTNAQGERVYLDEATRKAETARADSVIASDC